MLGVVWELARFNTRESWLQWFAALWGASLAVAAHDGHLSPMFVAKVLGGNVLCHTLLHGTACTWNDIIDRHIDAKVERTRGRPLPSGRISVPAAFCSYAVLFAITSACFHFILGSDANKLAMCNQLLYVAYPYAKRYVKIPQLVLAPAVGWPGLVGWASVMGGFAHLEKIIPLVTAVSVWTIYFDTAYGSQDAQDDKKIGVNSLAVWIGDRIHAYLAFLGTVVVGLLAFSAYKTEASLIFWIAGIGVWMFQIPRNLRALDLTDRTSGGKVFRQNISLGGYISLVAVAEMAWQTMKGQLMV